MSENGATSNVGGLFINDARGRDILNISKEEWNNVICMYEYVADSKHMHLLQWYPLQNIYFKLKITFYNEYISNSSVVMLDSFWYKEPTYALRSDGNIRNITLVSPLLFLVIECFGRKIWSNFEERKDDRVHRYYSGNYEKLDANYHDSYVKYCSEVNNFSGFGYYIKTDIKNFYDSISLDTFFKIITQKIKAVSELHLYSLLFYEELFKYCGNGKYPTIDNSVALSYLSCIVYLEDADFNLRDYLDSVREIQNFKIVRYQDDMYILFNTVDELDNAQLSRLSTRIQGMYATELSKIGLTLNIDKSGFGRSDEIMLTHIGWYNENYPTFETDVDYDDLKIMFRKFVSSLINLDVIDYKRYKEQIENNFTPNPINAEIPKIERSASEFYNHFTYSKHQLDDDEFRLIEMLILEHPNMVFIDPKRFFTFAERTKQPGRNILFKNLLHPILLKNDGDEWNAFCLISATEYLMRTREMKHEKLMAAIKKNNTGIWDYIDRFCLNFPHSIESDPQEKFRKVMLLRTRSFFIYSMLKINLDRNDILTACSYCFSLKETIWSFANKKKSGKELYGKDYKTIESIGEYRHSSLLSHSKDVSDIPPSAVELKTTINNATNAMIKAVSINSKHFIDK